VDLARNVPAAGDQIPSLAAYEPEHINELLAGLAQVDQALGQPVPKKRMNGGIVGIEVPAERLLDAARIMRDTLGFEMLTCVSGADMVDHLESLYHLRSISHNWLLQVRVKLPSANAEVDSLVGLYPAANWLERETFDMYGIVYRGHPDLRRILLDDEFNGYPLLKSFHPTPLTVHDRATTQTSGERAVSGEQQRGMERITPKHLGQGDEERVHPGKLTFGSAAVYLTTGQGVEDVSEHGFVTEQDTESGGTGKPQRG
jgi:NADH/F420H2 dehydrogenase subunit C